MHMCARACPLQALPHCLVKLPKLSTLIASHNPIAELPGAISKLTGLLDLQMSHCALAAVPQVQPVVSSCSTWHSAALSVICFLQLLLGSAMPQCHLHAYLVLAGIVSSAWLMACFLWHACHCMQLDMLLSLVTCHMQARHLKTNVEAAWRLSPKHRTLPGSQALAANTVHATQPCALPLCAACSQAVRHSTTLAAQVVTLLPAANHRSWLLRPSSSRCSWRATPFTTKRCPR